VSAQTSAPRPQATPAAAPTSRTASGPDISAPRATMDKYCVTCHNQKLKTGNLELDKLDLAHLGDNAELGEKIVRKLRAGMMPPANAPRPDATTREAMIRWMENELDRTAVVHLPPPGLHRLNRTEYANVIRDLLGVQVDATKFLPSDDSARGFDNMAG